MNYNDMDDMLKYQVNLEREKGIYYGNPNIYKDGKPLEIFPENNDKVNGLKPLFVFATTVYLCFNGKFLMLKQEKTDKVVDTLVGLGGKVKAETSGKVEVSEKADIANILSAYYQGSLDTEENMKKAAAREVMEETSTYSKDANGDYTHNIIKSGIVINPGLLNTIGTSRVRIINSDKTECWMIQNYIYNLSKKEYDFIESEVSKTNREGSLIWLSLDEALPRMSYVDQIILKNRDSYVTSTEIRDNVNNHNVVRATIEKAGKKYKSTMIDGLLVYYSDEVYNDLATQSNNIYKQ